MEEIWKTIVGQEIYEVSNRGGVRTLPHWQRVRGGHLAWHPGCVLKPWPGAKGHLTVTLADRKQHRVHVLVLEAFVGSRLPGLLGLHKDGNLENNCIENLYWGTYSDNLNDSVRHGTHPKTRMTECKAGHPLRYRSNGYRYCPICNSRMARESKARKRQRN